jgi:3-phosphoshikimate 1-carboxyvinyltransferase
MNGRRTAQPATGPLRGEARVPGDKSIAHRAVLFNALGRGNARVVGLPDGGDVGSTIHAVRSLGCRVVRENDALRIEGRAMALAAPPGPIDCGNSGTTMRLLMGVLSGQGFAAELVGDSSLSRRPMERVAGPLRTMGARVETTAGHAPVRMAGGKLVAAEHRLAVASAQVKSALLLAGLQAEGRTKVVEPAASRDHTERMLAAMGVTLEHRGETVSIVGPAVPRSTDLEVCGDSSSAAFLVVAATLVPGSDLRVRDVCLNPTRVGFVQVLRRMGARIELDVRREVAGEPVGDIHVRASELRGVGIAEADVPATIDELPVVAVAAAVARGTTEVRGAAELRVKESDRIETTVRMLRALGGRAEATSDGMVIEGGTLGGGACVETAGDHRLVMAAAVAALVCRRPVEIGQPEAASVSFPAFFEALAELMR